MAFTKSHGITISFDGGFLGTIRDIDLPEQSREKLDTSHHGTDTYKTYLPADLVDNGELSGEMGWSPGTASPIADEASEVTITFRNGATWSFDGFLSRLAPKAPVDDLLVADFTLVVAGEIEITDSGS